MFAMPYLFNDNIRIEYKPGYYRVYRKTISETIKHEEFVLPLFYRQVDKKYSPYIDERRRELPPQT